jgi:hypothetical protein
MMQLDWVGVFVFGGVIMVELLAFLIAYRARLR